MNKEEYYSNLQMDKIQHGIEQLTEKVIHFHSKHEERSNHILKDIEIIKSRYNNLPCEDNRELIMANKSRLTTHSVVGALITSLIAKILFWR